MSVEFQPMSDEELAEKAKAYHQQKRYVQALNKGYHMCSAGEKADELFSILIVEHRKLQAMGRQIGMPDDIHPGAGGSIGPVNQAYGAALGIYGPGGYGAPIEDGEGEYEGKGGSAKA